MQQRSDFAGKDGYTWWVGEVENVDDPAGLGRVKVRILGWYTGHQTKEDYTKTVPTSTLPWATVLLPTDKAQVKNAGTGTELQSGAWVLGFFLDGEEAQLPCVMGALRGFQTKADDKRTTVADGTQAEKRAVNPNQAAMDGTEINSGSPLVKIQSEQPSDVNGGQEESRGTGISTAEQTTEGNAVSNPIKPPTQAQSIADGAVGPAGDGFEKDMTRMLTELGTMASSLATNPAGTFVSMITGKSVSGDKMLEHLGKIFNFISGGLSGILAPLKEFLAEVIAKVVNQIVKIVSKFIPLAVLMGIMDLLQTILDLFCITPPGWLGLVQSALGDVSGFANSMANMIVDKVVQSSIGQLIQNKVQGITDRILGGIKSATEKVGQIASTVVKGINTAKALAKKAREIGDTLQQIFSIDFTSLDWGDLIGFIKMLLGLFVKKDCGRKIKRPKSKQWFPLLGSTDCDNLSTFIMSTPYASVADYSGDSSGKSYINSLFEGIDPTLMAVQGWLNGTKHIEDATPGKFKSIVQGPGGVTKFQDSYGNEHTNVPNNETKIIARDQCTDVKGNKCVTIEGDYNLKVMGNFNLEVIGAFNENMSNGPQAEASGSSKKPPNDKEKTSGGGVSTGQPDKDAQAQEDAILKGVKKEERKLDKLEKEENKKADFSYARQVPWDGYDYPRVPGADKYGRHPNGAQLKGQVQDKKEQKSAEVIAGDHNVAYTGDVSIQGNKVKLTAISNFNINGSTIRLEGNTIQNVADGEITNEANWISSFLNAGRFEFVGLFNVFPGLIGQFSVVKGSIVDITCDVPFPGTTPPVHMRIGVGNTLPTAMADIILGTSGAHFTFVTSATGAIGEIVSSPGGAIVNQVTTGLASYGVGTGFMATGCAVGPHQVYGLPLLLN